MSAGGGLRFGSHRQPLQTRAAARYSCSFGVFVVHGHPDRMGFGRLLSGVVSGSHPAPSVEEFGSSQPKPRAWRRKHIADGPEGAASRGASKAKVDPPMGLRAAARVFFTVETTVLPSFALPRGSFKWEGFVLVLCVFQPRIDRIFTNGKRLRRRFCLLVLFVFIRDIGGSRTSGQVGQKAWFYTFSV